MPEILCTRIDLGAWFYMHVLRSFDVSFGASNYKGKGPRTELREFGIVMTGLYINLITILGMSSDDHKSILRTISVP